jgi:hypothetical protein
MRYESARPHVGHGGTSDDGATGKQGRRGTEVSLASRTDVRRLLHSLGRLTGLPGRILVPGLLGLSRNHAEVSLNAPLADCGCAMGGLVMSMAVVGYAGYVWAHRGSPSSVGWHWVIGGVVVSVVAATVGKMLGLLLARRRLVRGLKAVETRLPEAA